MSAESAEREGLGATEPGPYSSPTAIGTVYGQLDLLWRTLNAIQPGDGSIQAGIDFGKAKEAFLNGLSDAMATLAAADQSQTSYQNQLLDYGNSLRAQVTSLQAQCGGGGGSPAPPAPSATPSAGTFTGRATGLIGLGSFVLGGILGFAGAKMAPETK